MVEGGKGREEGGERQERKVRREEEWGKKRGRSKG